MNELQLNEYLAFAKKLAKEAGDLMVKYFKDDVQQSVKDDKSIVTVADEEINKLVIERIAESYPEHSVLGEEVSAEKKSSLVWVCDPVDGTFLFAKGIPLSVFSLALVQDGAPVIGVVFDPFHNTFYSAIRGQGAYMNEKRIKVSNKQLDYRSALDVEDWPNAKIDFTKALALVEKEKGADFYSIGSVIHVGCYVARGTFEAVIFAGTVGKFVDMAALKVIVEEAGGMVTDIDGKEQRYDRDINGAIVSNSVVHQELIDFIGRGKQ